MAVIFYILCTFAETKNQKNRLDMKKKTYRVERDSELGRKLMEYNLRAVRCNDASDELARQLHAKEYIFLPQAEVGGIGGVIFEDGYKPDMRHWDSWQADDEQRTTLFVPRLNLRNGFAEECEEPEKADGLLMKGERIYIVERNLPYEAVMYRLLDYDAQRMTGINLRRQNLLQLSVHAGVPADVVHRIRLHQLPISVLESYKSEQIPALREAILAYQQVDAKLTGRKFFEYLCYQGTPQAMSLFERMVALPTIPCYTLNRLFGYRTDTQYRVAFEMMSDGSFDVQELVEDDKDEN